MIEVIPFRAEHALDIEIRDISQEVGRYVRSEPHLKAMEQNGFGRTAVEEGKILGSLVFAPMPWPGVVEAGLILSPDIERRKLWLHRIFKQSIDSFQRIHKWHRIQCIANAASDRNNAWLGALGFQPESVLEALGPKMEDYIMWVRIRKNDL